MPYIMDFTVDGGCRPSIGYRRNTVAAAAAVLHTRSRGPLSRIRTLMPTLGMQPTNQRAELVAMIMALEWALARYRRLDTRPRLIVRIRSDSRYAVGCVTGVLARQWVRNGWLNARGVEVANRDLIEEALGLADEIDELDGTVTYQWIPRHQNEFADNLCRQALEDVREQLLREEEEAEKEEWRFLYG